MKISKNLLNSIAVGLVIAGSMSSCGVHDDNLVDPHEQVCDTIKDLTKKEGVVDPFDCPPCGMG